MNTNMTGFRGFSKIFVLWTQVASAFEGLRINLFSRVGVNTSGFIGSIEN